MRILLVIAVFFLGSCAGTQILPTAENEFEKGLALFNDGKYEQAIPYFTKTAEMDPDHMKSYLYIGRSYLKMKRWVDAISPLQKAYKLAPQDTIRQIAGDLFDAFLGAGISEFKKGNYQDSIDYFREGLKLKPGSKKVIEELGKTLLAFGKKLLSEKKIEEAISAYKEAIKISPGNFAAYLELAKAFFRNGDIGKALEAVKESIRINPKSKEAYSLFLELLKGK
ncbi:MAG: tetratricopeptide repeat protein [Thermodesulfobacteriota bacterium]|nr:tetratricopeptide repeat protein [Thermodesulfobacteriota bacterium]